MIAKTLEINWHDGQAVYSTDFAPDGSRFATGGADTSVRIWDIQRRPGTNKPIEHTAKPGNALPVRIDFLCELKRHSSPVNVVRFSPTGDYLASAGDDACVIVWRLATHKDSAFGSVHSEYEKETWTVVHMFYGHTKEIYDLAWSPCGQYFMTASIDNTARVWSIAERTSLHIFSDHTHYVQGVTWDPLGEYVATQSSDRSIVVYKCRKGPQGKLAFGSPRKHHRLDRQKMNKPDSVQDTQEAPETALSFRLYHDENLVSFFRRLWFSPDGALLLTPSGLCKSGVDANVSADEVVESAAPPASTTAAATAGMDTHDDFQNCAYFYARNSLSKYPIAYNSNHPKPSIAIRWCSKPYELRSQLNKSVFGLPYRMLYAIATQDTIFVYDTQQAKPICALSGMHFAPIMDLAWSPDGTLLMFSSADGYLSAVVFADGELGQLYDKPFSVVVQESVVVEMPVSVPAKQEKKRPVPPTAPAMTATSIAAPDTKKRRIAPTLISALHP
ncbi:WD40-repeat-containing domain protein [Spinellus fusiger]|nr:WD40-repeat-containing domain protein [Spinellus fusiger]